MAPELLRLHKATDERTFGALFRDIGDDVKQLVRAEVRMVIAEARRDASTIAAVAVLAGAGVLTAVLAVGCLLYAAIAALAQRMPAWEAALIVGAGATVVAIALVIGASSQFSKALTAISARRTQGPEKMS